MPVSFVFAYACPIAQRYWQRRAWNLSLLATIWKYGKSTHDSTRPRIDWSQKKDGRAIALWLLQSLQLLSLHETTKRCYANLYLRSSGERNREQRRQAYQPSRICHESHNFSCNLNVSQAVISISRFLAAVANSHRFSAKTHGFAPPSQG